MKQTIDKLHILVRMLGASIAQTAHYWRHNVWAQDLDDWECCSGYECGCRARTIREVYLNSEEPYL